MLTTACDGLAVLKKQSDRVEGNLSNRNINIVFNLFSLGLVCGNTIFEAAIELVRGHQDDLNRKLAFHDDKNISMIKTMPQNRRG